MSVYNGLLQAAVSILNHPAFAELPVSNPPFFGSSISLSLPTIPTSLKHDLERLGCSNEVGLALEEVFQHACMRLEEECRRSFSATVGKLRACSAHGEEDKFRAHTETLANAIANRFEREAKSIRVEIVNEVRAAKTRRSSSSISSLPLSLHDSFAYPLHSPPLEPSGTFTEEVVSILQKAFETSENLTRAEVKGLIQVTGLNNKQIRTWFANARQRRGRKAAPYDAPRRPSQPSKQSKSRSTNPPLRNVSNSSSSSDSSNSSFSSLVSYASTLSTDITLPEQLNVSPIQLERSHSFSQASSKEEEEDVPMDLSTLDPPPSHFPRSSSLPSETGPFPKIPPAPSTAETDQFFSLQHSQPPSHHPTLNPASQFFDVQYSQATTTTNECNPNSLGLSFLSQIQETDPFLDDQFLQNVFGTLGVTQGGGLTLSMDSFREEEEEEMMGGEGGGGMMVEFAARGENGGGVSFGW